MVVILLAYFWCYITLRMTPKWYYIPLNTMGFLLWYLKWQDHLCGKSTWPAKKTPLGCYFEINIVGQIVISEYHSISGFTKKS